VWVKRQEALLKQNREDQEMNIKKIAVYSVGTLAVATIASLAFASFANAESLTWGWSDPIDGLHGLTQMWQEEDGATGHSLALATGQTEEIPGDRDAKIVVVTGEISVRGMDISQLGFATLPSGAAHEITCLSNENCHVLVEIEPTSGVMSNTSFAAEEIPWFEVPDTGGAVSLAWVWGESESPEPSSFFLRFQPGFPGFQHAHTHGYQGIVLKGVYQHWEPSDAEQTLLPVGAVFRQDGGPAHDDACLATGNEPCIAYFRIESAFDVFPAE
jgi:hypothetical protein